MLSRSFVLSGTIYLPLVAGYLLKRAGKVPETLSTSLVRLATWTIQPVAIAITFWGLTFPREAIALPLTAVGLSLSLLPPAWGLSCWHAHAPSQRGSYLAAVIFSNIGLTLGGFLCLLFLGEEGLGLSVLYMLSFMPLFVTVGFSIGRRYRGPDAQGGHLNVLNLVLPAAVGVGFLLNLWGPPRPDVLTGVNRILVPITSASYAFAIGLSLRLRSVLQYRKEALSVSLLKFGLSPPLGLGIGTLLGLEGTALKVVLVEAAMPVALNALVLAHLFDLDRDLANACWIATTLAVLPLSLLLGLLLPLLQ